MAEKFASVEAYIGSFPGDVQEILRRVRATILDAVPGAGERISYNIPTVTVDDRYVVYFSGWKSHISVYPLPSGDAGLDADLAAYKSGKGTLKFPLGKPIPYELIGRVAAALAGQRRAEQP
jgi:uncharacterized protein YdhG (YjbR/CyaY superfamily)